MSKFWTLLFSLANVGDVDSAIEALALDKDSQDQDVDVDESKAPEETPKEEPFNAAEQVESQETPFDVVTNPFACIEQVEALQDDAGQDD